MGGTFAINYLKLLKNSLTNPYQVSQLKQLHKVIQEQYKLLASYTSNKTVVCKIVLKCYRLGKNKISVFMKIFCLLKNANV